MFKTTCTVSALLLSGLLLALGSEARTGSAKAGSEPLSSPQSKVKEADVKSLGKAIAKYYETPQDDKSYEKVLEKLYESLEKLGKPIDKDDPMNGALSQSAALGQAMFMAELPGMKKVGFGSVTEQEVEPRGAPPFEYAIWLPKSYRPSAEGTPCVVVLPGLDENEPMRAKKFLQEHWNEGDLRDSYAIAVIEMPANVADWDQRIAAEGQAGGESRLMNTLRHLSRNFSLDPDRMFLAGRGRGVETAVKLANLFPHLWAGVVGQAGDAGDTSPKNFRNLPTLFIGGGGEATAFEEANKQLEYNNCTLVSSATDDDILAWLDAHPRNGNPEHVTLFPGSPIPNRAYWLQVPPIDGTGVEYVDAKIDRVSNTITIEGSGIELVVLHFNDQLVDLSQPIKLILNEVEQEVLIPRDRDQFIEMMYNGVSDPGRCYTARRTFDLPRQKSQ